MVVTVASILRAVLALVVGFSPATMAYAHGESHHRAVHEQHGVSSHTSDPGATIAPVDHDRDHEHPRFDIRPSVRAEFHFAAAPGERTALAVTYLPAGRASLALTGVLPRAGPVDSPPRPSRAPPSA